VLTNLVGLSSKVFTNVPLGGTNISVRTTGGTNFIDTIGELNNWSSYSTNVWNSRQGGNAVLTNLIGTVSNNVTNENSTALQINSGTLTLTPGGLSNVVLQANFDSPNISSNWNQRMAAHYTNYPAITVSNFTLSFLTNSMELNVYTNINLTNIVGHSRAAKADLTVMIRPLNQNATAVWPAAGVNHLSYNWRTNSASTLWTTLTNNKVYILSLSAIGTNLFPTLTLWE